jgi:hypothetical protein
VSCIREWSATICRCPVTGFPRRVYVWPGGKNPCDAGLHCDHPQNSRELWGCLEGLSAVYTNKQKVKAWLSTFPGALNDTGDLPEPKRMNGIVKPQ